MSEIKTAYKYLKSESYYNNLYDKFTVEECRRIEKMCKERKLPPYKGKKFSKKGEIKVKLMFENIILYTEKGERWKRKAETIREWMERDEAKDERLENAAIPTDIFCKRCNSEMIATYKDLHGDELKGEERVLFFFECPNKCKPNRAIFEDGEEYFPKPHLCEKCNAEVETKDIKNGNIITITYTRKNCGHKGKEVFDYTPKKEKIDKDFEKDRKRFCLSEADGQKYIESEMKLKYFSEWMKELEGKKKTEKAISKIKKLPVARLKKLLVPRLEKEDYTKLEFSKPEMGRDVIVEFTVQDNNEKREEYDSRSQLKKLLKQILEKTNWRLMSDGIYYRLGILTGRLRGYEDDEDLLKLVK